MIDRQQATEFAKWYFELWGGTPIDNPAESRTEIDINIVASADVIPYDADQVHLVLYLDMMVLGAPHDTSNYWHVFHRGHSTGIVSYSWPLGISLSCYDAQQYGMFVRQIAVTEVGAVGAFRAVGEYITFDFS